jgi:hypothetical protein
MSNLTHLQGQENKGKIYVKNIRKKSCRIWKKIIPDPRHCCLLGIAYFAWIVPVCSPCPFAHLVPVCSDCPRLLTLSPFAHLVPVCSPYPWSASCCPCCETVSYPGGRSCLRSRCRCPAIHNVKTTCMKKQKKSIFNSYESYHRLNMELDLHSFCLGSCVHSCTYWLRPRNSPLLPPQWGSYTRALLGSQDRRLLFVTPWILHMPAKPKKTKSGRWGSQIVKEMM